MSYIVTAFGDLTLPSLSSAVFSIITLQEVRDIIPNMPLLDLNDIDESTQEYIDKTKTVEEKGQDTIDKIEEKVEEKVQNRNTETFMHHLGVLKTFLLSKSLFYTGCSGLCL